MSTPLHIVRLVLDRRELMRLARRHHLGRNVDEGYLLHAGLAQLFATSKEPANVPLHTFAVDDTLLQAGCHADLVFLLAYSDLDQPALVRRMGASDQSLVRSCQSREVPTLPSGTRAAFRVRICPIVRTRRPLTPDSDTNGAARGRSREVDAWLAAAGSHDGGDSGTTREELPFAHTARVWSGREAVYAAWLAKELGRNGGAILDGAVRLAVFKRDRVYRRNADAGRVLQRPNAVMEGVLRVEDTGAFRTLLRRGLGRHRAFGFGMLLLRPQRG